MRRTLISWFTLALCANVTLTACGMPQTAFSPPHGAVPAAQRLSTSAVYAILRSFSSDGGIKPVSKLLYYDGAFYGTAMEHGGLHGVHSDGTIFRIDPQGHERVLYRFRNTADGYWPMSGLTEAGGRLYGTTHYGAQGFCQGLGCGTIYSILPSGQSFTTLYQFTGNADGGEPNSDLTLLDGTLYGTTQAWDDGGCFSSGGCGTVFAFTLASGTFKTLHAFRYKPDGNWPSGGMVAAGGTLYGTASYGGLGKNNDIGYGGVFSVTPAGKEHMVYRCKGDGDCSVPSGGLTLLRGKLYGTSMYDTGYKGNGVVFTVTPGGKERTLHRFDGDAEGKNPGAPLTLHQGLFYGTTLGGGVHNVGTVFSVTPGGALEVLHDFGGASDGGKPTAAMTFVRGSLYGTLPNGGDKNKGLVFSLTP